jgi:5-methylcytosine-specific restriction endonuclease McrA
MPIKPENKKLYPEDWKKIRGDILERANNKCEFCPAINYMPHPDTGSRVVLTIAHLDHNPTNNDYNNLRALCQRCHNRYDNKHRRKNANITRENKLENMKFEF